MNVVAALWRIFVIDHYDYLTRTGGRISDVRGSHH